MRFSLLGLLLALPFFAGALGMLDDFESDVEFLDKSYSDLKKNGLKSNFRDEYRARITVVSDRAFRLQHSADKLGIPEVRAFGDETSVRRPLRTGLNSTIISACLFFHSGPANIPG